MEVLPIDDVSDIGIKYLIEHRNELMIRRQNMMNEISQNNQKIQTCNLNTYHQIQIIRILFLKKRHLRDLHKMMSEHYDIINALMDL